MITDLPFTYADRNSDERGLNAGNYISYHLSDKHLPTMANYTQAEGRERLLPPPTPLGCVTFLTQELVFVLISSIFDGRSATRKVLGSAASIPA